MKRIILAILLMALFVSSTLWLIGCGGGNSQSSTAAAAKSNAAQIQTSISPSSNSQTLSTKPASTPSLTDILKNITGVTSIKYDSLITGPGGTTVTQKIWANKTKMRSETSMQKGSSIILTDMEKQTMYNYLPDQNTAIKMDFNQASAPVNQDPSSILKYNPQIMGIEPVDGKLCLIIQFTREQSTVREWRWQEKGLPLKVETATATGKTTMEMKNIDFSVIPDSMFDLPAGVKIVDIGQINVPTNKPTSIPANIPSNIPTNKPGSK
jgi:hypothetical protein